VPPSRREFLLGSLPALATLVGCGRPRGEEVGTKVAFPEQVARARERGADFLLARQASDGAWRSETYGTFKDGSALTPLALNALLAAAPEREGAIRKAAGYLAGLTRAGGEVVAPAYGFDFALYTAALTVTALSHPRLPGHRPARDTWLHFLKRRQLTEELGWSPGDREYGGWGYSRGLPRKPRAGQLILPLTESNLSATTCALDALRSAGVPAEDPAWARALTFVGRCQNWDDDPARRDPAFDDGGFFFIYDDPVRNKAGVAGTDRSGRERYHSYGSATADGFRCLIHCGVPESDPRPRAARAWLVKNFRAARHPGTYARRREADRMGVYHYYAASLARAPSATLTVEAPGGPVPMKRLLAGELLKRQRPDGSWSNPAHAMREDDPILATSFSLIALT
jgi:squalene-hopene/tetraprenyl-beta-curcumene cyclase